MLGSMQGGLCKTCGAGVDIGRFLHVQGAFRHSLVEMFIQQSSSQTQIFYAYTAEVLPSAHRATGSGIAASFNRIMGIVSTFVASSGNTTTAVPLYVYAALFGALALIAVLIPFEPNGCRSS